MGMKVNCQRNAKDELLVMVKRSMKRQVRCIFGDFISDRKLKINLF